MPAQTVTVSLPPACMSNCAGALNGISGVSPTKCSNLLTMAVPVADELPDDLQQALTPLALLDDAALWRAARTRMPKNAAQRLAVLHAKRQREGLTEQEDQERAHLLRQYERAILVRAQAAALLHERGHDS